MHERKHKEVKKFAADIHNAREKSVAFEKSTMKNAFSPNPRDSRERIGEIWFFAAQGRRILACWCASERKGPNLYAPGHDPTFIRACDISRARAHLSAGPQAAQRMSCF